MSECMYRYCEEKVTAGRKKGRKKLYCCTNHQQMEAYHRNKDAIITLEARIKKIVESMLDERLTQ